MVVDAEVVETARRQLGFHQPSTVAIRFFRIGRLRRSDPVCTENLSSGVVVVKSAKDGV
jgi:hypothetical protein